MIDKGCPQLARVDGFGNFWHGSYSISSGWRSRSGAVMSGFPPTAAVGAIATAKAGVDEHSAHLVDFGMPTQATPASEAAAGMERWNKAVLHGADRAYAIGSDKGFGKTGWPYRSPDGTVWFLTMVRATAGSQNVLQVKAGLLNPTFSQPTAIIASINVPTTTGGDVVNLVNFSPDGKKATGHSYNVNIGESNRWTNTVLMWYVDAVVSGGDAGVPPSVALTLAADPTESPYDVIIRGPRMQLKWTETITYINVQATSRTAVYTYDSARLEKKLDEFGAVVMQNYSSTSFGNQVLMVVYGPDNARHVLRARMGDELTYSIPQIVSSVATIYHQDQILGSHGWGPLSAPKIIQAGGTDISQVHAEVDLAYLVRDSVRVIDLSAKNETLVGGHFGGPYAGENYPADVPGVTGYIISGPTKTGNGWVSDVSFLDDSALRMRRVSDNAVALISGSLYVQWKVLAWISANGSGLYGAATPLPLPNSVFPAINPESGVFVTDVRLYF